MDEKVLAWSWDIDNSIKEIEFFFEGKPKVFEEFEKNLLLKRAVERNLEIIGEAMNRILKRDPAMESNFTEARAIVNLRNMIIHSYDAITDDIIWGIIINRLPILSNEVTLILKEHGTL